MWPETDIHHAVSLEETICNDYFWAEQEATTAWKTRLSVLPEDLVLASAELLFTLSSTDLFVSVCHSGGGGQAEESLLTEIVSKVVFPRL